MKSKLLFLICLEVTFLGVRAENVKFNPITKKELSVTRCDFYPEAKVIKVLYLLLMFWGVVITNLWHYRLH